MVEETTIAAPPAQEKNINVIEEVGKALWGGDTSPKSDNETPTQQSDSILPVKTESSDEISKEDDYDVIDADEYLKNNLGWDNWESAKTEIEQLRKIKENPYENFSFADDNSKKIFDYIKENKEDELLNYFQTKKSLSTVNDLDEEGALKLFIKQVNPFYSQEDIDDVYKERYNSPRKPVQRLEESEDDFREREAEWKEQTDALSRRKKRDAAAAKIELSKLIQNITLPDIGIKETPQVNEQQQKDLEAASKIREDFMNALSKEYKNFTGLTFAYKDDKVEIPVTFSFDEKQQSEIKDALEDFDVDDFISRRWFDNNGKPNTKQALMDMAYFKFGNQMFQKFVQDGGAKRLEAHLKKVKNIEYNGNASAGAPSGNPIPSRQDVLNTLNEALYSR